LPKLTAALHDLENYNRQCEHLERLLGQAHVQVEEQRARRLALEEEIPYAGVVPWSIRQWTRLGLDV
jgi:hypothetical protein